MFFFLSSPFFSRKMVEEQEMELGKISKALRDRSEPLLLGRLSVMLTHHRFPRVHAFVYCVLCVCVFPN